MKQKYGKPIMQVDEFLPNSYCVSQCGVTEQVYLFECTAPSGRMYYYNNSPATGPKPASGSPSTYVGTYNPCHKKHEAPTQGDFTYGFIDRSPYNGREDAGEAAVLYLEHGMAWNWWHWQYEEYISNGHATGNLDIQSWEITKS